MTVLLLNNWNTITVHCLSRGELWRFTRDTLKIDTWGNLDLLHNEDHKSAHRDLFLVFNIRNLAADAGRKSKQLCRGGKIQRGFAHSFVHNLSQVLHTSA